jgi:hypothetical protein
MNLLNIEETKFVSGAVNMTYTEESKSNFKEYSYVAYTMQYDGSLPPEFQKRIDAGESFRSMQSDMMAYQYHLHVMKSLYPEMFTA